MTQNECLEHLVEMATGEKRNLPPQKAAAWRAALDYAQLDPYQLAEIPTLLTQAMLAKQ